MELNPSPGPQTKLIEPDEHTKTLVRELRAAERNVEVLANLCDYMSRQVSEFTRRQVMITIHHIEHLRCYQLDPEHPEYGARWVYERPLVWRDQARYEDAVHKALKQRDELDQMFTTKPIRVTE